MSGVIDIVKFRVVLISGCPSCPITLSSIASKWSGCHCGIESGDDLYLSGQPYCYIIQSKYVVLFSLEN